MNTDGTLVIPVNEGCASTVAAAIGLHWESFAEQPETFTEPASAAQIVIEGFLVAVEESGVPLSLITSPAGPKLLVSELADASRRGGLSSEDDGGQAWFQMMGKWIVEVRYAHDQIAPAHMAYRSGTLLVADLTGKHESPDAVTSQLTIVGAAGDLIHETSHGFVADHLPCPDNSGVSCGDSDKEGAYAAEAWWFYTWLSKSRTELNREACWYDVGVSFWHACLQIDDVADYVACEDGWDTIQSLCADSAP